METKIIVTADANKKTVSVEKATMVGGLPIFDAGFNYVVNKGIETYDDTVARLQELGFSLLDIRVKLQVA